jgi:UDP-N-acetylmuramyl pentapeptide phosphotransferase/UDP-N-acetylglucosamine-1-phosphate transferase
MTELFVVGLAAFSAVAAACLWRAMASVFASPILQRQNYAGRTLAVGSGLVVVLTTLVVATGAHALLLALVDHPDDSRFIELVAATWVAIEIVGLVLGFGFLGLLDDVVGDGDRRGLRGHVGAALHGQVTTGFVKLVGGIVVAYWAVAGAEVLDSLRGALVIAATANLGNLFDRAPGRTIKVSIVGVAVVFACGLTLGSAIGMLIVVAAGVGVLVPDLRERCMLGDTGSNVLGAAVGWGLVAALEPRGQWIALAVVVALNLLSEKVSFSRVIDATPPLRWFDRLGSLRRVSDA